MVGTSSVTPQGTPGLTLVDAVAAHWDAFRAEQLSLRQSLRRRS